jgi:hypothetical protein
MTVTKDLKITGLTGNDSIDLGVGILKLMGHADINLGDGSNVVDGYMTSASFAKTLTYTGGSGSDQFTLGGTVLALKGAVDLELFGGKNDVDLHAATITMSDAFTMVAGDASNTLKLGNRTLSIAKATTVTLGSGGNFVTFQAPQSSFGAVSVTTTGGSDVVTFSGTKLAASGLVKFDLGAGQDFVTLNSSVLALKAGLTYLGGADADNLNLSADGTITGDVNIDLGGASDADQFLFISGNSGSPGVLKIAGALTLSSSATNTGLNNTETINVRDVVVTKAISVTGGTVDSKIYLNNASTGGTFTLSSGAGNDDVQIETFGTFGPMTIAKSTTIMLGDGNDNLVIGISHDPGSNDFVRFLGPVSVDGGTGIGTDTINDLSVNFFAPGVPTPVPTNFP